MSGSYSMLLGVVELIKGKNKNTKTLRIYGKWIRRFGVLSSAGLIIFTFMLMNPVAMPHIEEAEAAPISSETNITVAVGKSNAEVDLLIDDMNGSFASSTEQQKAQFTVATNNYTGYTLYIVGTDDDQQLVNSKSGETVGTLDSITSAITESSFASSSTYNNKWGYLPSKYNSSNNTSFRPAPTASSAQILDSPASAGNRDYTIGVGARADYSKEIGTYTDAYVLSVVAKPVSYTITFANTISDNSAKNIPSNMSGTTDYAMTVTLPAVAPTSDYYVFRGWCTGNVTNDGKTCSGTIYNAGSAIDINQTTANDYALKAVWWPTLQYLEDTTCTTTASQAADIRDGQVYTIKRLADGRCWMIDNLNLGATDIAVDLTSTNSNLTAAVDAATFNSWKKTATALDYANGVFMTVDGTDSTSGTKYGTLYNYYAATGGSVSGSSNTVKAEYDICPAGWRMPVGGTVASGTNELNTLYVAYGSSYDNLHASVANGGAAFNLAGGWTAANTTPGEVGTAGYFWTQTAYTSSSNVTNRWNLKLAPSTVTPGTSANRRAGRSIRCVLRPSIANVTNLQDFNGMNVLDRGSVIRSIKPNTNYTLVDNRDSQEYTVAKLKDGRVWITQNLNFYGSHAVTTANTNTATGVTAANMNTYNKTGTSTAGTYTAAQYIVPANLADSHVPPEYGVLYNYQIATSTTIKVASSTAEAASDLCPKGWRMPSGVNGGEFGILVAKYEASATALQRTVAEGGANLNRAGNFLDNTSYFDDGNGYYWTSTAADATTRYALKIGPGLVDPYFTLDRKNGASIRCVLKASVTDFTLQEMNGLSDAAKTEVAASMTTKVNYPLLDERDGQAYTVAKYATGAIWMTENLNLGAKTLNTDLTSANTNVSTTVTAATVNGWKKDTGTPTYTSGEFISQSGVDATSKNAYGTLYNYCAASAGTICTDSNSLDATSDLCPAGWRLPTGGTQSDGTSFGDFGNLRANTNYNTAAKFHNAITAGGAGFAFAGNFYDSVSGMGVLGFWWSSTFRSNEAMYSFNLNSSSIITMMNLRSYGLSIRCILK